MVRQRVGRAGVVLFGSILGWYLWIVSSGINSDYEFNLDSPYLVAPATSIMGLAAGAFICYQRALRKTTYLFILVVAAALLSTPIYANASAAVGGLVIALVGLNPFNLRLTLVPNQPQDDSARRAPGETQVLGQAMVLAFMLCAGVLLVLDAQAAIILTVPVSIVMVFTVWRQSGPPQMMVVLLGLFLAAAATLTVVFLGSRPTWPDWLADGESLSSARHTLWSDALSLWATKPLVGAGPGSFTPSSELASSVPSLAAVHSLPLQVGAELGVVGVVLLAGLFLAGMLFAARGSRPVAFIAIAAWTALAVHSSIDHLEDFPIVAFMGGVVLGWSGFRPGPSGVSPRTENSIG